jgi:hypothetical protein
LFQRSIKIFRTAQTDRVQAGRAITGSAGETANVSGIIQGGFVMQRSAWKIAQ